MPDAHLLVKVPASADNIKVLMGENRSLREELRVTKLQLEAIKYDNDVWQKALKQEREDHAATKKELEKALFERNRYKRVAAELMRPVC